MNNSINKIKIIASLGFLFLFVAFLILGTVLNQKAPKSNITKAASENSVDISFVGNAQISAVAGTTYPIAIKIDRLPTTQKIASARIVFEYPTNIFTYQSISYGVGFNKSALGGDGASGNQVTVVADARDSAGNIPDQTTSFLMATINFTVNSNVVSGTSGTFSYKNADIAGENSALTVDKTSPNTQINKTVTVEGTNSSSSSSIQSSSSSISSSSSAHSSSSSSSSSSRQSSSSSSTHSSSSSSVRSSSSSSSSRISSSSSSSGNRDQSSSSSSHSSSSSSSSRQSSSSSVASSASSASSSSSLSQTAAQIILKLRFQGIITEPGDTTPQNVKVSLVNNDGENLNRIIESTFLAGGDGTYKGTVVFDPIDTNAKYYIYVKGPKHLQKKFCDASPQLNTQGFYNCSKANISLIKGENVFNFSKVKLLSGDLPEQGNVQNGIIDAYDLSFMRSSIANNVYSKTCDINLDKKCDWQDWSLILASMAEKYDE